MTRGLRSGLWILAVSGVCGVVSVVGCSADGGEAFVDPSATEPQPSAELPPPSTNPGDNDAGKPGTKDAGSKDAAPADAGPPPPVPGTACTKIDEVRKKACGACGTQSAICLGAGGDASTGTWSEYSPCEGELAGGCIPGTVVTQACGNCGTQTRTCNNYCAYTTSACAGQPAGACVPGGVDLSNAGCADPDTFRQRTCSATCAYGSFSGSCSAAPTTIEVGPTVGSVTSTIAVLSEAQTLPRITGTCPNPTVSTTISPPYLYLQVHNPLSKTATVAIYNSQASGGGIIKTALAAYAGATPPGSDDASRKACLKGVSTYGTASLTGNSSFASLDGTKAVTLAPDETVTVFLGAYNAYDPAKPADSTGKVKLNVQTMTVN